MDTSSYWIKGWVSDRDRTLDRLVAFSPEGCPVNLLEGSVRVARPDLAEHHAGASIDSEARKGFLKFVELAAPSRLEQGWIVELHSATGSSLACKDRRWSATWSRFATGSSPSSRRSRLGRAEAESRLPGPRAFAAPPAEIRPDRELDAVWISRRPGGRVDHRPALPPARPDPAPARKLCAGPRDRAHRPHLRARHARARPELAAIAAQFAELYQVPFRVACLNGNAGYAIANNLGASIAKGRLLLLLELGRTSSRPDG